MTPARILAMGAKDPISALGKYECMVWKETDDFFKSLDFSGLDCNSFRGGFALLDICLDHLGRLPSILWPLSSSATGHCDINMILDVLA